jgi:hypothetical protein
LIDTNLLLLLFVGEYSPHLLSQFKRTQQFNIDDLLLLKSIIHQFNRLLTTPSILTEVSNLSNQLPNHVKQDYFSTFANQVELFEERYIPSINITKTAEFTKFGLTDATIHQISTQGALIVTIDFPLANMLESRGLSVINFNHLRGIAWFNS